MTALSPAARDALLARAAEAAPGDGLAVFGLAARGLPQLLAANAAFATLLGARPGELAGEGWAARLRPGETAQVEAMLRQAAAGAGPPPLELQSEAEREVPRQLALAATAMAPPPDEAAGALPPVQVAARLRDVTTLRQAERGYMETERLRTIAELSADLAHALTNQLTVIAGAIDLAHESVDRPELARPLAAALRATAQATALLRRLQALARHDPQRPERVDPAALLPVLAERFAALLPEHGRLDCEVAPGTPVMFCDPRHLETALLSVVFDNSGAPEVSGPLRLRAAPRDGAVEIGVSGLPPRSAQAGRLPALLAEAVGRRFAVGGAGSFHPTADGAFFRLPAMGGPRMAEDPGPVLLIASGDDRTRATLSAQAEALGYRAVAVADGEAALARLRGRAPRIGLLLIDTDLWPQAEAAALARAALALAPGLAVVGTGEVPADWPVPPGARVLNLNWRAGLRDFAEMVGHALGDGR